MKMKNKISYIILFCMFIFLASVIGCAKVKKPPEEIIARVNDDPIYASDLKRELTLKTMTGPHFKITPHTLENEIDSIINKRLLIQEAQKLRLGQTKRFVDTIKTFWEQTLIRDLIVAKEKEFESKITVTDREVRNYHAKLGQKVTFKIIKRKDKAMLEKMLEIDKDLIAWEDEIGPVGYEDIESGVLQRAFALPAGVAKILRERDAYYLVYVAEKQPASAPPLEEIYPTIEKQIKIKKYNQIVKKWLKDIRDKAEIEINKELLNTFAVEK